VGHFNSIQMKWLCEYRFIAYKVTGLGRDLAFPTDYAMAYNAVI
jgi:hypothetical protein